MQVTKLNVYKTNFKTTEAKNKFTQNTPDHYEQEPVDFEKFQSQKTIGLNLTRTHSTN